jgi:hypothetical protein
MRGGLSAPGLRTVVRRELRHPRAHLLPPLDYFDFIALLRLLSDEAAYRRMAKPTAVA